MINLETIQSIRDLLESRSLIDATYFYLSQQIGMPINQIDSQLWSMAERVDNMDGEGEVIRHWMYYYYLGLGLEVEDVDYILSASRGDVIHYMADLLEPSLEGLVELPMVRRIRDPKPAVTDAEMLDWAGTAYTRHTGYVLDRFTL